MADGREQNAKMRLRRRNEHRAMPWKNGSGTTYEVARQPAEGDAFGWRLSFAEVNAEGPFSTFPGIDRVITLVDGTSMALTVKRAGSVDGNAGVRATTRDEHAVEHVLLPYEPFAFAGEDEVFAAPAGPTLDFNVMTARNGFTAEVSRLTPGAGVESPRSAEAVFVTCLSGSVDLALGDATTSMHPLDVAELHAFAQVTGDGVALVIRVSARD